MKRTISLLLLAAAPAIVLGVPQSSASQPAPKSAESAQGSNAASSHDRRQHKHSTAHGKRHHHRHHKSAGN
jgi:hypothetical protein